MDLFKVALKRVTTQLRGCRRANNTALKVVKCDLNNQSCHKINYPFKFSSIGGRKFPNSEFIKNQTNSFNNNYNKGFYSTKKISKRASTVTKLAVAGFLVGSATYYFASNDNEPKSPVGEYNSKFPNFTKEQVAQHKTREMRIWVTYKQGVYDVTDFMKLHPGGESTVMMAAGGNLEPYWTVYTQHNTEMVFSMLEKYRIGNLIGSSGQLKKVCYVPDIASELFTHEPQRDPRLIPVTEKPFNGGAPPPLLTEEYLTPNEIFYVRNHLPVPFLDNINDYKLTIEIEGGGSKTFTLADIKKMPSKTVTITAQCGGLRRQEMTDKLKRDTQGVKWAINGVSNATWTGVTLVDVLKKAGFTEKDELQHLQFTSMDSPGGPYVTGIPIQRVLNPKNNVMLCYEMNGKELHPDHGWPLRVVVPGCIGARWVKQIEKIEVRKEECQSHWHQQLYKYFGPHVTLENADYSSLSPVQELPVMSAILSPSDQDNVVATKGVLSVKGFAYSGGGSRIARVELSADKGKTWMPATFKYVGTDPVPYHFTWTIWQCDIPTLGKKCMEVWVKATDSSGNTQPENWEHIYNIRGVSCNAYHKIRLNLK